MRHLWVLLCWSVLLIAALGVTQKGAAQTFSYDHTESAISASLGTYVSTTDVPPGTTVPVGLTVTYSSWEIWVDENGNTETINPSSGYATGAYANLSVTSGDASLSTGVVGTEGGGQGWFSLYMGSQATEVHADVTYNGATATATFSCSPPATETFTYDHTESSLTASLSSADGSTNVSWGSQHTVTLQAQYNTWEVWTSNLGNTENRNSTSAPAQGAMYYLSMHDTGSIDNASGTLDSNGMVTATETMSNSDTYLRADVSYSGYSTVATLNFTVSTAEVYSYDHTEHSLSMTMTPSSTAQVTFGVPRAVEVSVQYNSWEVWVSNYGNMQNRNASATGASGATVNLGTGDAGSSVSPSSSNADSGGIVNATFYMNYGDTATVSGDASYAGLTATASTGFTSAEVFTFNHSEGSLSATLTAPNGTQVPEFGSRAFLFAVNLTTWDVYTGSRGSTETRNSTTTPAGYANYNISLDNSPFQAFVSPNYGYTDWQGHVDGSVSLGSVGARVLASASYYYNGTMLSASASLDFGVDFPPPPEVFVYDHTETGPLTVSVYTASSLTNLHPYDTVDFQVNAAVSTYEVWRSNYGNTENRNSSGMGVDGYLSVSRDSGDGTLTGGSQVNAGYSSFSYTMGGVNAHLTVAVTDMYGHSGSTYVDLTASGDEYFVFDHSDSGVIAHLTAPDGTTQVANGATRDVTLHVTYDTWEVWVGNQGHSEIRNRVSYDGEGAYVTFSVPSGDGTVSVTETTAGAGGLAYTTFTMGAEASQLKADVSYGFSTTATLDFTPPDPEVFVYDHTDSSISATLTAPDGSTEVPYHADRAVNLHATLNTIEIWVSNYGNTESRNPGSSDLSSAAITYTVTSGNGSVTPGTGTTDTAGNNSVTFTMNSLDSRLQADVSSGSYSTTATLDFSLPGSEIFTYDHTESSLTVALTAPEGTSDLPYGTTRTVYVQTQNNTWQVWVSNRGNSENRNPGATPVAASLTYSIESGGDGSLSTTSGTADGNGQAQLTFTMGNSNSRVHADASYGGNNASGTLDFSPRGPETFTYDHQESSLTVSLNPSQDPTNVPYGAHRDIGVTVLLNTWQVWVGNYGSTDNRNYSSSNASGAGLSYTIEIGSGSLSTTTGTIEGGGSAYFGYTMGNSNSRIRVDATYSGYSTSASVDFTLPAAETFYYDHTEYSLSAHIVTTDSTSNVQPGSTLGARVQTQFDSWQIWISDHGNTENRNSTSSGASGASIAYTFETGDGVFSTSSSYTDYNGDAMNTIFTGIHDTVLRADVTYSGYTVSATLQYTVAEAYAFDHTESYLTASLTTGEGTTDVPEGATRGLQMSASLVTRDVWISNYGHTDYRNVSTSTPYYGSVTYSGGTLSTYYGSMDYSGMSFNTLYMGSSSVTVQADVSYNGYNATATLTFTPAYVPPTEVFSYNHTEYSTGVGIYTSDNTTNMHPGDSVYLTISAWVSTYEVWTSNFGNTENRNSSSYPLDNTASLSLNQDGDGYFWGGSSQINSGYAMMYYTVGTQSTHITATVNGVTSSLDLSVTNE